MDVYMCVCELVCVVVQMYFFPRTYMQAVKTIDSPEKTPRALDNWIDSIAELHRQKPPQTVHYTRYIHTTFMPLWVRGKTR